MKKRLLTVLLITTFLLSLPVVSLAEGQMQIAVDKTGENGVCQIEITETTVSVPLKIYAGEGGSQLDHFDASCLEGKVSFRACPSEIINASCEKIGPSEDGYCYVKVSAENLTPGTSYSLFVQAGDYISSDYSWNLPVLFENYAFVTLGEVAKPYSRIWTVNGVTTIYYAKGTMEVAPSGSDSMRDYTKSGKSAWSSSASGPFYKNTFTIDVRDGVKHIGNYTFSPMINVTTVTTGQLDPLTSIGEYSFKGCTSLRDVYLYADADAMTIAPTAFDGCSDVTIHVGSCGQVKAYQDKFGDVANVTFTGPEHTWDDGVVTTEATVDAEGVKTYTCSVCGETKTEAIDKLEPAAEEPAAEEPAAESAAAPKVIEGAGQKVEAGKPATFRADIDFADFAGIVKVDGNVVDKSNYDAKEGSTIITLHADYVKTLGAGNHTIAILSKNGTQAESSFSVAAEEETVANTDGSANVQIPSILIMFVISAFGGVAIIALTSNKKEKDSVLC